MARHHPPNRFRFFDRVIFINLANRPDRREAFEAGLPVDWPFRRPERFAAIDTTEHIAIDGCGASHRYALRRAFGDGVRRILVMEDDAVLCPGFAKRAAAFLRRVPADWDALWLGGEHMAAPVPVDCGVVQCVNTRRTHCYAVQGAAIGRFEA